MRKTLLSLILISTVSFYSCSKDDDIKKEEEEDVQIEEGAQKKSFKRGVSYNFQMLEDVALLGPGISWFYNWGPDITKELSEEVAKPGLDYYPMIWNGNFSVERISAYKRDNPECEYILAFNEPNLTDQANMTPAEAAVHWPAVKHLADSLNMKIIAPAMNYGTLANYHDPIKWLDEFFEIIPIEDVHGISIHCYMGTPASLKSYVNLFKKYNLPIWMTEFCAWESYISNITQQMNYMCDVLNYMECDPDVYRYAWFIPRWSGPVDSYPYMQLLTKTKPYELSDLGKVYVNFSTFDKETYYIQDQKIPAEHYSKLNMTESATEEGWINSVRVRPTTDEEGELELTNFLKDYWVEYQVSVPSTKEYKLDIRYAGYRAGVIEVLVDGKVSHSIDMPSTGEDDVWETITTDFEMEKGKHTIRLKMEKGSLNINWLQFR